MSSYLASQVFNIVELAEMILLHADHHQIQFILPRVSRHLHDVITGSVQLQQQLHNADHPRWADSTMCLAPISTTFLRWSPHFNEEGRFPHHNPPQIPLDGSTYERNVHFEAKGLDWACDSTSTINHHFRNMLVCQPPAIALDTICFSTFNWRPHSKMGRIENQYGITCGEFFDHIKSQAPVAGQIHLAFTFRHADSGVTDSEVVPSTP